MPNIITWNMEGGTHSQQSKWQDGVRLMDTKIGPEIFCLQEAGPVPGSAVVHLAPPWNAAPPAGFVFDFRCWPLGTTKNPKDRYILWGQTDPGGHRVNIAIVTRAVPTGLWYVANPIGGRPALGVELPAGEHTFSVHCFSGGGGDAPGLVTAIDGAVPAGSTWRAAGDFNREPNTWPGGHTGTICPPDMYTRWKSKKKLDYMVRNAAATTGGVISSLVLSDHFPVQFAV